MDETDTYKYLGVIQSRQMAHTKIKKQQTTELTSRRKKHWKLVYYYYYHHHHHYYYYCCSCIFTFTLYHGVPCPQARINFVSRAHHVGVSIFLTLRTVATLAVFWNSALQCLPEMPSKYTWSDPERLSVTRIAGITFTVAFHMRCTSNGSCLCFSIFLSFFSSIHFIGWNRSVNQNSQHVLSQSMMWSVLHGEVLSVTICWSQNKGLFQLVVAYIRTICPLPLSLLLVYRH
jgi:hypothetical protein